MEKEENNGFGPIFEQRGWGAKLAAAVVFLFFLVSVCIATFFAETKEEGTWKFYIFAVGFSILAWMIGEIARRLCLFVEEARHRRSRYEGSLKKAFEAAFDNQNRQLLAFIAFTGCILVVCSFNEQFWDPLKVRLFYLNAIFVPIFIFLLDLNQPPRIQHLQVNEKENKNLADGLAWSYYFGYLKFVLPALKTQIHLTEKYRDSGSHAIVVKKMFILIPKNCYVFDTISNKNTDPNNLIERDGNLEPLKKSRGGILDRIYKNTVHCIIDKAKGEKHYCIVEYATPLMTLNDMSNDEKAGLSREERDIQANLFVAKLKKILDGDDDCKGKYELVTYAGGNQDIAEVMIRALKNCALEIDY